MWEWQTANGEGVGACPRPLKGSPPAMEGRRPGILNIKERDSDQQIPGQARTAFAPFGASSVEE